MTKRFEKAYNALCQAFFNGTLAKGTCVACAIGNIVADAVGVKFDKLPISWADNLSLQFTEGFPSWWVVRDVCGYRPKESLNTEEKMIDGQVTVATGYTNEERCIIETVFEKTCRIPYDIYHLHNEQDILEDQYRGLCAVFDVLCKLDNVEVDYETKLKSHPKLQAV